MTTVLLIITKYNIVCVYNVRCVFQVWCVQEEEQQYLNWTVDSGTHTLDIRPLQPGRVYWIRVAAVNGAGVGAQTNPYKLLIGTVYTVACREAV